MADDETNGDGKHYGSAPSKPSPTAPRDARPIDKDNPLSSTARPAGHAVNGDTSTTDISDSGAFGTGTALKNK